MASPTGVNVKAPALQHRKCSACGRAADVKAVVDLQAGAERVESLVLICRPCNRKTIVPWPTDG